VQRSPYSARHIPPRAAFSRRFLDCCRKFGSAGDPPVRRFSGTEIGVVRSEFGRRHVASPCYPTLIVTKSFSPLFIKRKAIMSMKSGLCRKAIEILPCLLAALAVAGTARATVFFTDDFSYADGQLTSADSMNAVGTGANVSGGNWTNHSGLNGSFIQVASGKAVVVQPGQEDANRVAGSTLAAGGNTWYYGLKFTVTDTRSTPGMGTINPAYFIHFKESGTSALRSRLYMTQGADQAKFSLGLSSSSVATGNGAIVPLGSDLDFGTEYTAIVSYTSDDDDTNVSLVEDGFAKLWVNPTPTSMPNIIDNMPNTNISGDAATPMTSLALRQSATSGQNGPGSIAVNIVSIGDSFTEVLSALGGAPVFDVADFNHDNNVDDLDLTTWRNNFSTGTTNAQGDASGDMLVDGQDLLIWQQHETDNGGAVAAVGAVPEPAAAALALLAGAAVLSARRRK
jgi:hypothetical protein